MSTQIKKIESVNTSGSNIVVVATVRNGGVDTQQTFTFTAADVNKLGLSALLNGGDYNVVPATATDPGTPGEIAYDATHIYVCVAANTWVRALLATW